jgi:hypothetical protein
MSDSTAFDIPYISRVLNTRKAAGRGTVLVLGSRTGGLFRSKYLYETLKPYGKPSQQTLSQMQQFAECYRLLASNVNISTTDIDTILRRALREMQMSKADISLAELIKQGLFDLIITTNMDSILEDSLKFVGMKELYDFEVFRSASGTRKALTSNVRCRIVKVFGDLSTRQYTVRRGGYFSQNQELRSFLEEVLARDVMVIGLDPLWDAELSWALPLQGDVFWYINEEAPEDRVAQIGNARFSLYFTGENAAYAHFLPVLYKSLTSTPSPRKPAKEPTTQTADSIGVLKEPLKIFISYVSEDEIYLNSLVDHLSALKHEGTIREWYKRKILPGQIRKDEINTHLNNADIILLLVSANFMGSDYIQSNELARIMQLHQERRTYVIPIILRPVDWESGPFGHLEPLPRDGKPVTEWKNRDLAWLEVVRRIRKVIQEY